MSLLFYSLIDSKIGQMHAIADDKQLYMLNFADKSGLSKEIQLLCKIKKSKIIPGYPTTIINSY